ncbi:MAG: AAA family ATPase [Terriglobales bacterium]
MLSRIYIDNFRCFVNFEYRPKSRQLILGRNGSGKSSLLAALLLVRQFVTRGDKMDDFFVLNQRTRWMSQPQQTWELEVTIDDATYAYRLIVDSVGEPPKARVAAETVHLDRKPVFEFLKGEVHLYNDRFEKKVTFPFDPHRSALATITERKDNTKLTRFKRWIGELFCFQINPFVMTARADGEDLYPNVNLSNFPAWYRHLVQSYRKEDSKLLDSLRGALDDFGFLEFKNAGENVSLLFAEFAKAENQSLNFGFHELSEGQRCLICLYAILHFVVVRGGTVVIDEPDNFISLRELQPWLSAVSDAVEGGHGQIIIISHHPEFINQWAPQYGVQFVRDGNGPVRIEEFQGEPDSRLSPADLIARGWERG